MVFSRQGGSIGRRAGNDWVLPDAHVSGRHARIRAMGGTFFLEDNESAQRCHRQRHPHPCRRTVSVERWRCRLHRSVRDRRATLRHLARRVAVGSCQPASTDVTRRAGPSVHSAASGDPAAGGLDDLIGAGAAAPTSSTRCWIPPPSRRSAPYRPVSTCWRSRSCTIHCTLPLPRCRQSWHPQRPHNARAAASR